MSTIEQPVLLGEGILTWPPAERELGRFGTVCIRQANTNQLRRFDTAPVGEIVRLAFTVEYVCVEGPPPDRHLGIEPQTPCIGEEIDLGIGLLFVLDLAGLGPVAVGILPTEQRLRPDQWLDVAALYKAQNQSGHLTAHPFRGRKPAPYPTPAPA
jgi:hypothetical protein